MLFVPELRCNLISVSQLIADLDIVMQIANKGCVVQDRITRNVTGAGELKDGLYFFRRLTYFKALHLNKDGVEELWHQRLGHPSNGVFDLLPVVGTRTKDFSVCDTCLKAKHCREVFHSSENKSNGVFDMIHTDLWGPYRRASLCNSYYFLTIVDDFSRGVWVYLLRDKTQVRETLMNFMALISRQFDKNVKVVRSDNGTEFTCLTSEFKRQGIIHQTSCVGTPQQNGRVERKHRHILNVARALLFQSSLSSKFWGESVLTAAHLINRTPSRLLKGKIPYELIYNTPPKYENLRVFGCLAFAHNQRRGGDKFEARSRKCIFLGYPFGKKGWNMYDLETKEVFVSRDVVYVENNFPMSSEATTILGTENDISDFGWEEEEMLQKMVTEPLVVNDENGEEQSIEIEDTHGSVEIENHETEKEETEESETDHDDEVAQVEKVNDSESDNEEVDTVPVERFGHGLRETRLPAKFQDYVMNTIIDVESDDNSLYPLSQYLDATNFSEPFLAFLAAVSSNTEPEFFRDAVVDKRWRLATSNEVDAMEINKTWDLTTLPPGKKAIGCKWVFKIKYISDGTIERFKARLVALGNRQKERG